MPSSSRCCATGVFVLPLLLLLPLFLSLIFGVQGATLREHRLSGVEPVSYGPASQIRPPPSAEMLRALRYIQSLSQRTPSDTLADEHRSDQEEDDMESIRSMLQLAAPGRMDRGMEEREEERDNTQELLQAVLKTLQQTEEHMVPQKTPQKVIATQPRYAIHPFPRPKQQLELETSAENYGRTSWANPDSRRRHRKYPIMFDEEEDQEQPLKRTNENAEEEYTPQKLATLQSVFEELSGISASKDNSKRDDDDDDNEEDDDDNLYRQRKMALENIMETDDWAPLEEQTETEEEERERHGFNRDLEDEDQEEEEEEEDDDDVKRSNQPTWFQTGKEEDPEDIAKLVDYYLLRVLEKKEQEQQKRQEANRSEQESNQEVEKKDVEEDEDEEKEEREIKPLHNTVPVSVSQIIKISQQLRITPEEVLELLQNEKQKDLPATLAQSHTPYVTSHNAHKTHRRPLETSEGDILARDILSILELVNAVQQNDKRPAQPNTSRYYEKETSKDDYDNTPGEEDELASYLASEMLAQGQRRARLTPLRDVDQPLYGNLERAIQNYFDKSTPEKRTAERENAANGLDNNTMLKILRYLEPESDNIDETDSEGKTVPEM